MTINKILNLNIGALTVEKVLIFLLAVLLGVVASRVVFRIIDKALSKSRIDKNLLGFIRGILHVTVYCVLILIIADVCNISLVSLVAVFGVAGLSVSMAMESSLSNLAGGVMLLLQKPFKVDDYIKTAGDEGTVKDIGLFYTKIVTRQNRTVYIPNGDIVSSHIMNCTAEKLLRVDLKVTASYDSDTKLVYKAMDQAVQATDKISGEKAPFYSISEYKDSAIEYILWVWTEPDNYWPVYYKLTENLRKAFADNGVIFTYNHMNIHLVEDLTKKEQ